MPRKYQAEMAQRAVKAAASMRPGRMPRKYQPALGPGATHPRRFNEAGADAPEIPTRPKNRPTKNEPASMRPGRMPRKYRGLLSLTYCGGQASMRPGRMPRKYPDGEFVEETS